METTVPERAAGATARGALRAAGLPRQTLTNTFVLKTGIQWEDLPREMGRGSR